MTMTTMTMTTMTRGRGRGRNLSGAGAGNFKNGRLRQPWNTGMCIMAYCISWIKIRIRMENAAGCFDQCCGTGSVLDPYSWDKIEAKGVRH